MILPVRPPTKQYFCYCLPGGVQDKYQAGWAEVTRLIWYRALFSTSWTPTRSCQNYWLSAPMFLIKEVMRITRTGIRNAVALYRGSRRSFFWTVPSTNDLIPAFDHNSQVAKEWWRGWACFAKYGPHRHMFSICSLMEFSCGLGPH